VPKKKKEKKRKGGEHPGH